MIKSVDSYHLRGNSDPARTDRTWNGPQVVENCSAILARFRNTCKCNEISRDSKAILHS